MIHPTQVVAILIADMAGFSRMTSEKGIDAALDAIFAFQKACTEAVNRHRGRIVKFVADDAFCTFEDVPAALEAGLEIALSTNGSVGIGYGPTILQENDLWGEEVNGASRLGEDVASHGEVLLTAAARARLDFVT